VGIVQRPYTTYSASPTNPSVSFHPFDLHKPVQNNSDINSNKIEDKFDDLPPGYDQFINNNLATNIQNSNTNQQGFQYTSDSNKF
jgi:hypothetical protein